MKGARARLPVVITAGAMLLLACQGAQIAKGQPGHEYEAPAVRVTFEQVRSGPADEQPGRVLAAFDPVLLRGTWQQDGRLDRAEWSPLDLHPVQEMQVCFEVEKPCELEDDWQKYALAVDYRIPEGVEPGAELWLAAAFRDGKGAQIVSFTDPALPSNVVVTSLELATGGD